MSIADTSKMKINQTFLLDEIAKSDMLDLLGITHDEEGFLIYKDSGQKALSINGREMKKDDFGGVIKGSTLLMCTDIDSLLYLADKIEG